jgi:hypothetical protein
MTSEETDEKSFTCRYDILRTQVLETRIKKGETSVKGFAVSR